MEKAKNKNFRDNPDMSKKLGEGLRKILDDARTVAEAPHTKSERRDRILALCDNTEDVLQEISVKVNILCLGLITCTAMHCWTDGLICRPENSNLTKFE